MFIHYLLIPVQLFSQTLPSVEEKTKNLSKQEGYINFYYDENNSKIFLELNRLDSEMLYQVSLPAGLGSNDLGLDRGMMGNTPSSNLQGQAIRFLMIQPNYDYRAVTSNAAEKRAVEQSFAQSVLWGFTAEAVSGKTILVDATAFFYEGCHAGGGSTQQYKPGQLQH